jgi:hypothetical protein
MSGTIAWSVVTRGPKPTPLDLGAPPWPPLFVEDTANARFIAVRELNSEPGPAEAFSLDTGGAVVDWTTLHPSGAAQLAGDSSLTYDPSSRSALLIGGTGVMGGPFRLSLEGAEAWTPLEIPGPSPLPRGGHSAVLDAARNRIVLSGGGSNDVWGCRSAIRCTGP